MQSAGGIEEVFGSSYLAIEEFVVKATKVEQPVAFPQVHPVDCSGKQLAEDEALLGRAQPFARAGFGVQPIDSGLYVAFATDAAEDVWVAQHLAPHVYNRTSKSNRQYLDAWLAPAGRNTQNQVGDDYGCCCIVRLSKDVYAISDEVGKLAANVLMKRKGAVVLVHPGHAAVVLKVIEHHAS
ncbi:hypothetical protein DSO57_1039029 [Entomophthora muscae]|uniref:Uncharacterized protein n=1 Tax=Entomophthora muscae TaxID=34485 RepID=A0ACC2TLK7_9FUNG|nr:hypothetical protein DSO57_1039029 [Entomophthora muscae]